MTQKQKEQSYWNCIVYNNIITKETSFVEY